MGPPTIELSGFPTAFAEELSFGRLQGIRRLALSPYAGAARHPSDRRFPDNSASKARASADGSNRTSMPHKATEPLPFSVHFQTRVGQAHNKGSDPLALSAARFSGSR